MRPVISVFAFGSTTWARRLDKPLAAFEMIA